jgi:hypothetical protein
MGANRKVSRRLKAKGIKTACAKYKHVTTSTNVVSPINVESEGVDSSEPGVNCIDIIREILNRQRVTIFVPPDCSEEGLVIEKVLSYDFFPISG